MIITCRAWVVWLVVSTQCLAAVPVMHHAVVVGVTDGDTVTVVDDSQRLWKVRLAGIDAPEKRQAFGQQSTEALTKRLFGQQVIIEAGKADRYGRTVGKVMLSGRDVNLELVSAGLAWHYKKYQREQSIEDRASYESAEREARLHGLGLWQQADPVAPWDYRNQMKRR